MTTFMTAQKVPSVRNMSSLKRWMQLLYWVKRCAYDVPCCAVMRCAVLCYAVLCCAVLCWVHWPGSCCAMSQFGVLAVFSGLLVLGMSCSQAELRCVGHFAELNSAHFC